MSELLLAGVFLLFGLGMFCAGRLLDMRQVFAFDKDVMDEINKLAKECDTEPLGMGIMRRTDVPEH